MLSQPRFAAIWLAVALDCGEVDDLVVDGEGACDVDSSAVGDALCDVSEVPEEAVWLHPAVPNTMQMAAAMAIRFMPGYVSTRVGLAVPGASQWLEKSVNVSPLARSDQTPGPALTAVLIHGGCHGAWCWDGVIAALAQRGQRAVAFDMPGCGADQTPRQQVTLAMQIERVVAQIDAIPEGGIRLVGHSIGGWVLAPVAAARPERVEELVYVAAAALSEGQRGIDITPAERRPAYFEMAASSPDNSLMVSFADAHARFFNDLDTSAARAAYDRLTPQPFQPYLDPCPIGIESLNTPRRLITMSADRTYPIPVTTAFAQYLGVAPTTLPGAHCLMLSSPTTLAAALAGDV